MKYNSKCDYPFRLLELLKDSDLSAINKRFSRNYNKSGTHKIIIRPTLPEIDDEFITYKNLMEDAQDIRV